MAEEVYKQQIINRYQLPQHKGVLDNPTVEATSSNSLCGDILHFQLKIEEGYIRNAQWTGEGCAICLASADLLAESLVGRSVYEAANLQAGDIAALLGISLKPSREKCAQLSLECVDQCLGSYSS